MRFTSYVVKRHLGTRIFYTRPLAKRLPARVLNSRRTEILRSKRTTWIGLNVHFEISLWARTFCVAHQAEFSWRARWFTANNRRGINTYRDKQKQAAVTITFTYLLICARFKEFICEYNLFTQQHALLLFAINSFMLNCVFIPKAKIDFKIELLCKCKNYKEYTILYYETFDVSLSSH